VSAAPVASGPQTRKPATAPAPSNTGDAPRATSAAPPPAPPPVPAPIGFTLHYDTQTQQLILEARDPATGFVIYQIPPQSAAEQFAAADAGAPAVRGTQHDGTA
jgi:hypothetical protein